MFTKCKIVLLTVLLVAGFSFYVPSSAVAFVGSPAGLWATLENPLTNMDAFESQFGGNGGDILNADDILAEADVFCGVVSIECLGPILLGATVFSVVWKAGYGNELGSFLANFDNPVATTNITGEELCPFYSPTWGSASDSSYTVPGCLTGLGATAGTGYSTHPYVQGSSAQIGGNGFTYAFKGTSCNYGGVGLTNTTMVFNTSDFTGGNAAPLACMSQIYGMLYAYPQAVTITYANSDKVDGTNTCAQTAKYMSGATAYSGSCYMLYLPEAQFALDLGGTTLQPCGGSGQIACPSSPNLTIGTTTGLGCGGTPTPCQAALNKLDLGVESGVEQIVDCYLHGLTCPTTTTGTPFTLPRPQINETYDQYIARLRNLGYWGYIYEVDDDMDYPSGTPALQLNPGEITEVKVVTNPGPTTTVVPNYWAIPGHGLGSAAEGTAAQQGNRAPWEGAPAVSPQNTTMIEIEKVPASYTPVGSPVGGGGPCNCPGLDFSPLTGVSYGTHFPFGAFTFAESVFSTLSGSTGSPVSLTFTNGGTSAPADTVSFDSTSWTGTYRPIFFPIIEFLMTFLVVVFALRLIRHPGGDSE